MRKFFLVLFSCMALGTLTAASGCTFWDTVTGAGGASTEAGTVKAFLAACTTYKNVFAGVNLADKVHPLSDAVVARVNVIDAAVAKLCPPGGAMPTSALDGVVTILADIDALTAAVK